MKRAYWLPLLSLLGVVIAIIAIIDTNRPVKVKTPVIQPVEIPFPAYVAGAGIVEGGGGNTAIGTAVAGIVKSVLVKVGDEVTVDEPLFKIDDSDLQAQLVTARAKVREAEAALEKPIHRLDYALQLKQHDASAISDQALSDLRDDVEAAKALLDSARALDEQLELEIARYVVRAPVSGRILKVNTRPGEYAEAGVLTTPLMVLADDTRVHLRVDVDENDTWRIRPEAQAVAFVRGNPQLKVPLRYEYIEPYVLPKTSLTGQSTERTDIRVLQIIYSFERSAMPVYIGQQMDVYIQASAPEQKDGKRSP